MNNFIECSTNKKKARNRVAEKIKTLLLLTAVFSAFTLNAQTQDINNTRISIDFKDARLDQVMAEIERQSDFLFVYDTSVKRGQNVSVSANDVTVKQILDRVLTPAGISYTTEGSNIVLSANMPAREGQPRTVSGTVKDVFGAPVAGASVFVKGTSISAHADIDGNFSLTIPANAKTIIFSFVGMASQEVAVGNHTRFDVVMEEATVALDNIVVTALGIRKEAKSLSYNVQQINADDTFTAGDPNIVNSLSGKVTGAAINASAAGAGSSSRVILRGTKSISYNNNALYVIDGIPMPTSSYDGQPDDIYEGAGQTGDGIASINPEDIESISVLSGPSAAALYGSAAANGAILITTRRGQASGTTVRLSNSTTFSSPLILPQFQNTYGVTENGSYMSWGEKLQTPSTYNPADFFQTGLNVSNSLSLSTGTDQNQTYVSVGSVNAQGIIHNNDYERYNFSVRNTANMYGDKLTLDLGFMMSLIDEQNMTAQGLYFNPLVPVYLFPPGDSFSKVEIFERYNASRNLNTQYWPYTDGLSMQNPYWITERTRFVNDKTRYMMNAALRYKISDWINISGRVKRDNSRERFERKFNAGTNTLFASKAGYYSQNKTELTQTYADAIINIDKYFFDRALSLTANIGASIDDIVVATDAFGGKLLSAPNTFTYENTDREGNSVYQEGQRRQKQSVFGSVQVGYKGMVYLDVTARNDWASTLSVSGDSFFYPSVGLSGIVTDIFGIRSDILNYAKVRVSYSEVGNEPPAFVAVKRSTYELGANTPSTVTRRPTDLRPEHTKSWEAGINMVMFGNRLSIDATVYHSKTFNQFFETRLSAASMQYNSIIVNGGRVDNKGIELSARYKQDFGKLHWNTYVTYSLNRNKIVDLVKEWKDPETGETYSFPDLDMGSTGSYRIRLVEGGSMGDIYVNTLRTDEHGAIYVHPSDQVVVADANNFIYAGNSNPKYNLNWGNTLSYHGVSLGFQVAARVGGIVVSNTQAMLDAFGVSQASADARDNGGALVNGKLIPAQAYYQTVGSTSGGIGSMYCYSATNVRLSELTLGYDVPITKWVPWIKGLNVSFVGRNLFFFYNKSPFDPEVTASTNTYFQGVDYFMMPSQRTLGFSVKLRF